MRQEQRDMMQQQHPGVNGDGRDGRDYGFVIGMATGVLVGAGLTLWLAPRSASEIRARVTDSARRLRQQASDHVEQVGARVGEALDDLTSKGQDVRDQVADTVARGASKVERGAHSVERYAAAAKSDRGRG